MVQEEELQQSISNIEAEQESRRSQIDEYTAEIEQQQQIRRETKNKDVRLKADSRINALNKARGVVANEFDSTRARLQILRSSSTQQEASSRQSTYQRQVQAQEIQQQETARVKSEGGFESDGILFDQGGQIVAATTEAGARRIRKFQVEQREKRLRQGGEIVPSITEAPLSFDSTGEIISPAQGDVAFGDTRSERVSRFEKSKSSFLGASSLLSPTEQFRRKIGVGSSTVPRDSLQSVVVGTTKTESGTVIPVTEVRFATESGFREKATLKETTFFRESPKELVISSERRSAFESKIKEPISFYAGNLKANFNVAIGSPIGVLSGKTGRAVGLMSGAVGGPATLDEAFMNVQQSSDLITSSSVELGGKIGGVKGSVIGASGVVVGGAGKFISEFGLGFAEDIIKKPVKNIALYSLGGAFKLGQTGAGAAATRFFGVRGLQVSRIGLGVGGAGLAVFETTRIVKGVQQADSTGRFLGGEAVGLASFGAGFMSAGKIPKVARTDLILGTAIQQTKQVKLLLNEGIIGKDAAAGLRAGIDLQFKFRNFADVPVKFSSTAAIPKDLKVSQQEILARVSGEPGAKIYGSQSIRLRGLQEFGGDLDIGIPDTQLKSLIGEVQGLAKLTAPESKLALGKQSIGFGGEKAADIKPISRLTEFAFSEKPTLTIDKIGITRLSEQFSRTLSGTLELRKGGKDIGGAVLSGRALVKQRLISLEGEGGLFTKFKLASLRKTEGKLIKLEGAIPDISSIVAKTPNSKMVALQTRLGFLVERPEVKLPSLSDRDSVGIKSKKASISIFKMDEKPKGIEPPQLKVGKREKKVFGDIKEFKESKTSKISPKFESSNIKGIKQSPLKYTPSIIPSLKTSSFGRITPSSISQPKPSKLKSQVAPSRLKVSKPSKIKPSVISSKFQASTPSRITPPQTKPSKIPPVTIETNPIVNRRVPFGSGFQQPKVQKMPGFFPVLLRRGGKFKTVGFGRTERQAFNIGKMAASKTLGATFKVPTAKKQPTKIKGFRRKKTKEGIEFIEMNKFRLSTGSEIKEIQMFKKTKPKRRKKK